jgi:hypothetical protein
MDLLLYFGLFRTYIHEKQRLGPLYHKEKNSALKGRYSAAIAYLEDERYVMRI